MMIYSSISSSRRRYVWIALMIIATVNNHPSVSLVGANTTTRRIQRPNLSIRSQKAQKPQKPTHGTKIKQQEPNQQRRTSILVRRSNATQRSATSTVQTKPREPPEGIYSNKPLLRGQFHKWGAILFPPLLGFPLCRKACKQSNLFRPALIFCFAVECIMVLSATLHRFPWKTEVGHQRARKLDFTGIFVGIACFYSSMGRLVMGQHPHWNPIETVVWCCAICGTLLKWKVPDAPPAMNAFVFLIQGWATLPLIPYLLWSEVVSARAAGSLLAGAGFVTLGALAYSLQFPKSNLQPFELVFGPHEVFHAGTIFMFVSFWMTMWTRITELSTNY